MGPALFLFLIQIIRPRVAAYWVAAFWVFLSLLFVLSRGEAIRDPAMREFREGLSKEYDMVLQELLRLHNLSRDQLLHINRKASRLLLFVPLSGFTCAPLSPVVPLFLQAFSVILAVAFYTLLERKLLGYIQTRKGPNKPGPMGLAVSFADAIKLITKDINTPELRNSTLFFSVPIMVLISPLLL